MTDKYLYTVPAVLIALYLYTNYKNKLVNSDENYNEKLVKEFILNQEDNSILGKNHKPIIWIHVPYKINSRNWESFGSRNSNELNAPYLFLTIKTIIDKCGNDFNICLIDDSSFEKLVPNWNIEMDKIAEPLISKARTCGILEVLYNYGGIHMPISFLCVKNIKSLYTNYTENNKPFLFEKINSNSSSNQVKFSPSTYFMGCKKNCSTIAGAIELIRKIMRTDYTSESEFKGYVDKWFYEKMLRGHVNVVCGTKIGIKLDDNTPVQMEELLNFSNICFCNDLYGIYVPHDDIMKRTNYQWLLKLDADSVYNGNTILSLYFQKYLNL